MILDVDSAVPRLLEWGLLDAGAVVDGDVRVSSVARRNHNLRVEGGGIGGWLIKQPGPDVGSERTLRAEAAFYQLCQNQPIAAPVARFMARLRTTFPDGPILVFELLAGAEPLRRMLRDRWPDERRRLASARALGAALGTLHATFRGCEPAADPRLAALPDLPVWSLKVHRPEPALLASMTPARRRLLRIVQGESAMFDQFDAVRASWRGETMIHGDLRFDNVLVVGGASPGVRLVDWETVQVGDPAWDVGVVLQELVVRWLSGMPQAASLGALERVSSARYPLAEVKTTAGAFWAGYRSTAEVDSAGLLLRAVRFSAVRLVQTAWEDSVFDQELTSRAVLALQTGANVLADPERAISDLYALTA